MEFCITQQTPTQFPKQALRISIFSKHKGLHRSIPIKTLQIIRHFS